MDVVPPGLSPVQLGGRLSLQGNVGMPGSGIGVSHVFRMSFMMKSELFD